MRKELKRNSIVKMLAITTIALCAFSLSSALAQELRICSNKISDTASAQQLAIPHNRGQINFSDEEIAELKEHALLAFETAFRKITELGLSEADIAKYKKILPQDALMRFYAVVEISKLNISPEEKVKALIILGDNCQNYLTTWFTIQIVEIFLGTSCHIVPDLTCELAKELLGLADTVFFWGNSAVLFRCRIMALCTL
jgi:hypothetical protein